MSYLRPYRVAVVPVLFVVVSAALLFLWLEPAVVGKSDPLFFDAHFHGYSGETAQQILSDIGPNGIALYLAKWPIYDTVFPLCIGLMMMTLLWVATRAYPMPARLVVVLLMLAPVLADLLENARIGAMIATYQQSQAIEGVSAASAMSVLKWKCFFCAIAMNFFFISADIMQTVKNAGRV